MPSFLKSTLSLMALMSLITVIVCVFLNITIQSELLAVFTWLIMSYVTSKNPLSPNQPTNDTSRVQE